MNKYNTKLLNKTLNLINKYGIDKYKNNINKIDEYCQKYLSLDTNKFMNKLNYAIQEYYSGHTFIYSSSEDNVSYEISPNKIPDIEYKKLYGYIKIHPFLSVDNKSEEKKVIDIVKKFIKKCKLDNLNIIIDLTDNFGGNFYPMLLGFKDLFINKKRHVSYMFSFMHNNPKTNFYIGDKQKIKYTNNFAINNTYDDLLFDNKIAVIVNKKTASSAEIVAMIFQNRMNVKIFGEKTAGFLTSNIDINIDKDYSIALTYGILKNHRQIIMHNENIEPDVITQNPLKEIKKYFSK